MAFAALLMYKTPPGATRQGFGPAIGLAALGLGYVFHERFKAKKADAVTGQAGYNVSGSVRRRLSHTWGKAAGVENS